MNLISINERGDSNPGSFTPATSGFYFKVAPSFSKQDIYFTDGTEIGTSLIYDNATYYDVNIVGTLGDNLFFKIDTDFGEETLFYFDKVLNTTTQLAVYSSNFSSQAFSSYILDFKVYNGIAYYSAYNSQTGYELHQSDGTVAGTFLTMDINPSSSSRGSYPKDFTLLNGNMLFTADGVSTSQGVNRSSIWRISSNGTVEKITNSISDTMSSAQIINNELYYLSSNLNTGQYDIYKTDGTLFNESIVLNSSSTPNQYIYKLIGNLNNELLFTARKNNNVILERVNTNFLRTTTLSTLQSPASYFDFDDFQSIQLNNKIIFTFGIPSGPYDANLFTTDGTIAGSYFLTNSTGIQPRMRAKLLHKTDNDHVIFRGENDTNNNAAIYHLNPSNDQITITDKIFGSGNTGADNEFLSYNGVTYLLADDGLSGFELFSYNELQDIAIKIVDIENKGNFTRNSSGTGYPVNSVVPFKHGFIAIGTNGAGLGYSHLASNLYFYDPTNQSLNSLHQGGLHFESNFIEQIALNVNNNHVVFAATNGVDNYEPWVTDGTEIGTFQTMDINTNGSSVNDQTVFRKAGDYFFFNADDGNNVRIYYTNGTIQGSGIINPLNEQGDYRLVNIVYDNNQYYLGYHNGVDSKVVITDSGFNLVDHFIQSADSAYFYVYNGTIITIERNTTSTNPESHDIYFQTNSSNRQFVGNFISPYRYFHTYKFPRIRNTLTLNNQFHFILGDRHIITTDGTIAGTTLTPTLIGGSITHLFSINNRIFATDEYLPNTTGISANIVEINVGGSASDPFASVPANSTHTSYTYNNSHIIRFDFYSNLNTLTIYDVSNDNFYSVDYNTISTVFPFVTELTANLTLNQIFNDDQILALGRSVEHGLELYAGALDFSTLNLIDYNRSLIQNDSPIVYPIPVSDYLYINSKNVDIKTVALYDLAGKEIDISSRLDLVNKTVNLTDVQEGIYILNIGLIDQSYHPIKIIKN